MTADRLTFGHGDVRHGDALAAQLLGGQPGRAAERVQPAALLHHPAAHHHRTHVGHRLVVEAPEGGGTWRVREAAYG